MAVRKIRIWPDPALKEVAKPVETFDESIVALVEDLFETMYEATGIGLAATQIAEAKRVLVIDLDPSKLADEDPEFKADLEAWGYRGELEFINPEIIESDGSLVWNEGCLSVPGINDDVKRFESITVRAQDRHGDTFELAANQLFAVAIQHEMDHLDGKVFVEYLSKLKRDVIKRKMNRVKDEHDNDGVSAMNAL